MNGGRRRTINCPCGWTTIGSPRESDGKFKIHSKRCDKGREANNMRLLNGDKDRDMNGMNGMVRSRNGHLVAKPLRPTTVIMDGKEVKTDLTVVEIQRLQRSETKEHKA